MITPQQPLTWNHPKHNTTKGFSAKRLKSKFGTVALNILPAVFSLVPPSPLQAFFSGLQNHRRLLSTYNWASGCIYRQNPPFEICETQRRAGWTHQGLLLRASTSEGPAASCKPIRTFILLHNFIKGRSLQSSRGCNELRQMAPVERRGRRVQRNPGNQGSRPAAGALKGPFSFRYLFS